MRGRGFLIALTATGKENGMKTLLISACLLAENRAAPCQSPASVL